MITLGEEQSLGFKALMIVVARSVLTGLFFVFISILIIFLRTVLISGMSKAVVGNGMSNTNIAGVSSGVLMLLSILFFCAGAIIFFIGSLTAYLKHASFSYTLNQFDLIIKSGILYKKENAILYRQIRDVNIERPLLYQIFGLSRIDIVTSEIDERNEEGIGKIFLDHLDSDVAKEVMDIITKKVGVPILETTNKQV